jgi:hypothetical protein
LSTLRHADPSLVDGEVGGGLSARSDGSASYGVK